MDRILSERLWTELGAIRELVSDVPEIKKRVTRLESDMTDVKRELSVHREILTEHSTDLREIRLTLGAQVEAMAELKLLAHTH